MYCMIVDYPRGEGSTFDYDYYHSQHMPLCARLFADYGYRGSLLRTSVGKGPGASDLSWACVDLLFATRDDLQAALKAVGGEVSADVPNYTDVRPRMSFAEVRVDLG